MFKTHLKVLLRKNALLWWRNGCTSCCEIFLPTLFALMLLYVSSTSAVEYIDEKSYLELKEIKV